MDTSASTPAPNANKDGKGSRHGRRKSGLNTQRCVEDCSSSPEKNTLWNTADICGGNSCSVSSGKKPCLMEEGVKQSFVSHTSSMTVKESKFFLPSMLEVSGAIITPPGYKRGIVDCALDEAALEQSPLHLDSSEEIPPKGATSTTTKCESPSNALFSTSPILLQPGNRACDQIFTSQDIRVIQKTIPIAIKMHKHCTCKGNCIINDHILNEDHPIQPPKEERRNEVRSEDHYNLRTYSNEQAHISAALAGSCGAVDARSRSPSILPASPGREEVQSIFDRKNSALF